MSQIRRLATPSRFSDLSSELLNKSIYVHIDEFWNSFTPVIKSFDFFLEKKFKSYLILFDRIISQSENNGFGSIL